ncbi:B3 domain-containing protein Os07g0563300-like isoform X2 [Pistacia vera]|nr:B3 domain-containing protein Os07g0563300-like isoform X2 [Pistacia vera]
MASSSSSASMKRICFYCKTVSTILRPGWRLRNGCSALLCIRCASAYEEGRFCNIFHLDASGWRDCVTCKKIVHCGCIMSTHTHIELDSGGVRCTECISNDILMGANSRRFQFKNARPRTLRDLPEVRLCVDLGKVITGITYGTSSQEDACESREQLYTDSPDGVNISDSSTVNKKPQSNGLRKIHSYRRYLPEASDEDMQQIRKHSNSVVIPLFEKELTISDADSRNGRLVIPKKCAWDYLPKISEPQGFPIKIQDTGGKYWNFHYRFWPNSHSTMYVLEGTRDYMAANQCQPGDKVTFYRIDPEGQLVMGLKKAQASTSDQEKNPESYGQYMLRTRESSK